MCSTSACLCLSLNRKGHLGCPCGRARAILKRSGHRAKYLHCCACIRAPRRRKLSEFNSADRLFSLTRTQRKTERRAEIHTRARREKLGDWRTHTQAKEKQKENAAVHQLIVQRQRAAACATVCAAEVQVENYSLMVISRRRSLL